MTYPDVLALIVLVVAPALLAALCTRANADHIDRAMRWVVIGVAQEVLGGELPVGWEHPFLHADHLGPAGTPVTTVQHLVEVIDRRPQVVEQVRRSRIPRRPHCALV